MDYRQLMVQAQELPSPPSHVMGGKLKRFFLKAGSGSEGRAADQAARQLLFSFSVAEEPSGETIVRLREMC